MNGMKIGARRAHLLVLLTRNRFTRLVIRISMISNGRPTIPLPEQNSANLMATTLAMFECPNASIAFAIGNAITNKLKLLFNPFSIAFTNIAVSYVMQGLGFTILPGIVILGMEHLFYRLPLIDEKGHYLTRKTWLYYRNRSLANPVEQLFIKFMQTYAHVNAQKPDNSAFGIAPDTAYRG